MSTRISILTIFLLIFCWSYAKAQSNSFSKRNLVYEIHGGIGTANIFGDLGGAATRDNWGGLKDIQFSQTRPTFYIAGRKDINDQFSGKVNIFSGMAAGNDKGSINDERYYSYSGWLFEVSGQIEWNFLRSDNALGYLFNKRFQRGTRMQTRMYLLLGVGGVFATTSLNTHGSELCVGEYAKNHTIGLVIPYGLGVKSDINESWAVGLEIGRRYCTSDYLDGITTNWSKANDLYYFTTLHAIYKLNFAGGQRRANRPTGNR